LAAKLIRLKKEVRKLEKEYKEGKVDE